LHTPAPLQPTVLVVEDDARIRKLVAVTLGRAGYEVTAAANGRQALERVAEATPDLIVSDVMMPELDGFGLVARLRDDPATRAIPVILLRAKRTTEDVVAGLDLGADDYLPKPFAMPELLARVRSKLERPPVPNDQLPRDRQTGLLTEGLFMAEVAREVARVARGGTPGCLAYLYLDELPRLRERLGSRAEAEIAKQVALLVQSEGRPLDLVGRDAQGRFALLLPETDPDAARRWLDIVARRLAGQSFTAGGERVRLTPTIGFAPFAPDTELERLRDQALAALDHATAQLDLQPVRYAPAMEARAAQKRVAEALVARWWRRLGRGLCLPLQIAGTQAVAFGLPFLLYTGLAAVGLDITHVMYLLVVAALLVTVYFIWMESFLALRPVHPPDEPPPADATPALKDRTGGMARPSGRVPIPRRAPSSPRTCPTRPRPSSRRSRRCCASTIRGRCRSSWPTTRRATYPSRRSCRT
jgi:CheY-like chemotaxis protein